MATFFVLSGVVQLAWAGTVISVRSRSVLALGALGNMAAIGAWVASRTSGLPFVPGAELREPVGLKDAVCVLLEIAVVVVCVALLREPRAFRLVVPMRSVTPILLATTLIIVPGVVLPAHQHTHAHTLLAGGHGHTQALGSAHGLHGVKHAHVGTGAAHAAHGASGGTHVHASSLHATHSHSSSPVAVTPPSAAPVKGISSQVRYGPFFLPPKGLGGDAKYNRVQTNVGKPCINCYIVEMRPNLVYADGSSANLDTGAMLHHAVWTRPSINDATCGRNSAIGSQGQRFFAAGNERTSFGVPAGFGYWVGTDSWTLIVEIMNHVTKGRNVYVTLDVKYRPASDNLKKLTPVWMDEDNCADSQYAIPAGKSDQVWRWTSTMTGRIVAAGGHVHDGGVKTVFDNATTGQSICTSVAGYGTKPAYAGSIESMSTCSHDRIGTVRKGEELLIDSYYDSTTAQKDVMGIVLAFVYETTDLKGGSSGSSSAPPEQKPPPPHQH